MTRTNQMLLAAGFLVLVSTAAGCSGSSTHALVRDDSGHDVYVCVPMFKNGEATINTVSVRNSGTSDVTVTSVSLPKSGPMVVVDWFVDQGDSGTGRVGVGGPWVRPAGDVASVAPGHSKQIALLLKSNDPRKESVITSGVTVRYRTSGGSGEVTAGTDMGFVPFGEVCRSDDR